MVSTGAARRPRLPAEWEPHERTVICWPARDEIWRGMREAALAETAVIAATVSRFEPVTVVAQPERAEEAERWCHDAGADVTIVPLPIDDSWARDSGPLYVLFPAEGPAEAPVRTVVDFRFNAWGEKYEPHDDDTAFAARWAEARHEPIVHEDMVLEGGAVTSDGEGTLVTTQQCLLHPNRNPEMSRTEIEAVLARRLGTGKVVWLPHGLSLDLDTDGHVDNVAAFCGPGRLLLQGCDDPDEPDHDRLAVNERWIRGEPDACGRELEVDVLPVLPLVEVADHRRPVPYLNLYVCNGAVVVPVTGHPADDESLARIGEAFPDRKVVGVPGQVLALGGGGPHCVTQQVPAQPEPTAAREDW